MKDIKITHEFKLTDLLENIEDVGRKAPDYKTAYHAMLNEITKIRRMIK